jgi:hypothetical protein
MASISGLGPAIPPNEPRASNALGQALESYAKLFASSNPQNLQEIAQKTVELDKLAHSVMDAASPAIRSTAGDLEHLLTSPLSVMNKEVSILAASQHYLDNPATAELSDLVQVLCNNKLALGLMCKELSLLSSAANNPSASGGYIKETK